MSWKVFPDGLAVRVLTRDLAALQVVNVSLVGDLGFLAAVGPVAAMDGALTG